MPIARIQLPDGRVARLEVPEGTTPEQAQAYAEQTIPATQELAGEPATPISAPAGGAGSVPAQRGAGAELLRQLGLTARAGVTGLTGAAGVAGDALNAGINQVTGSRLGKPSEVLQRLMSQLGLPEPENETERLVQLGASVLAGGADPVMGPLVKALTPRTLYQGVSQAPPQAEAVRQAMQGGVKVTPSEAHAGAVGRALEGLSGRQALQARIAEKNVNAFNELARKSLGLPADTPLTPEVLANLMDETYRSAYEPIRAVGRMPAMPRFQKQLREIAQQAGVARSFPGAADDEIGALVKAYDVPEFDSADALEAVKLLRRGAKDSFRTGRGGLGTAQKDVARALEDNIAEYLDSELAQGVLPGVVKDGRLTALGNPRELLARFREGRAMLAKAHAVDDALVEGAGSVDALKLAAQLQRGVPLSGELGTMARFAQVAPKSAGHPKGGAVPLDMTSVLGGTLGFGVHPAVSGLFASRPLVRAGLASNMGQKLFVQHGAGSSGIDPLFMRAVPALGSGLFGMLEQ